VPQNKEIDRLACAEKGHYGYGAYSVLSMGNYHIRREAADIYRYSNLSQRKNPVTTLLRYTHHHAAIITLPGIAQADHSLIAAFASSHCGDLRSAFSALDIESYISSFNQPWIERYQREAYTQITTVSSRSSR
jgi:hypothetical protein